MARIAYLFSGLPRQWSFCIESQLRLIQDTQVDVFFHFWDTVDDAEKRRILEAYKPTAHRFETQVDFTAYESRITRLDNINSPSRMMSMYYSWKQVAALFREYQAATGTQYDFAVRLRADLMFFHAIDGVIPQLKPNDLMLSNFNNFGMVNDMFALGGVEPVLTYLSMFDHVMSYHPAVQFNPEMMLVHHLNQHQQRIRVIMSDLTMLVFRPHMVGMPVQECLREHPGMSKWKDPEVVEAHKEFHGRRAGAQGVQHVERFKNVQLMQLEQSKRAPITGVMPGKAPAS